MKKILPVICIAGVFLMACIPSAMAQGNGCASISISDLTVTPGPWFPGPVLVTGQIYYSVQGGASKAIEVIINGQSEWIVVSGAGSISIDVTVLSGSTVTVTVNAYSSHRPEKGKLCETVTKTEYTPT